MRMSMTGRPVRKADGLMAVLVVFMLLLFLGGCKEFGIPNYELTITVGEGIEGTPAAGEYNYKDLSVIEYRYVPFDENNVVEVLVNGSRWPSEGTVTMYTKLTLEARLMDIRGTWDFELVELDGTDVYLEFSVTFDGDDALLAGSFSDSRGYTGSWTMNGSEITISYDNWHDYQMVGQISSMKGTWKGEAREGNWSAKRADGS